MYFVEEMGLHINQGVLTRELSGTPLIAATVSRHEELALQLLALPGQGDLHLDIRHPSILLTFSAGLGELRLVRELLARGIDLDARNEEGYSALCMAAKRWHKERMNVLLEEYQARGRLSEALEATSFEENGTLQPILWHVIKPLPPDLTSVIAADDVDNEVKQLSALRELESRWGVDVRRPFFYQGCHVLALYVSAAYGNLSLTKYLIEECGLSVDELTPTGRNTLLSFACHIGFSDFEERQLPVIKYLLEKGADVIHRDSDGQTPQQITFKFKMKIYGVLGRHRLAKSKGWAEDTEVLAAKQKEADAAAQALLAELEAEEAQSHKQKTKRGKRGNGGKKKKGGNSGQGPSQEGG